MKRKVCHLGLLVAAAIGLGAEPARAAEDPYFITYTHNLEEPGNLEVSPSLLFGAPATSSNFGGGWTEIEYGVKGWWTTEFYADSQKTAGDSLLFTGWRWENRFRLLEGEHRVNPVLYIEYENISDADKILKEVVGFDARDDLAERNSVLRRHINHEIETKLILSTNRHGWNFSENLIAEKNLGAEPWEFGYAVGADRSLALAAGPKPCRWCRENFSLGIEMYGGLGTWHRVSLSGTSHYLAPVVAWNVGRLTLRLSPTAGLTHESLPFLLRFGISYEVPRFDRQIRRWFR